MSHIPPHFDLAALLSPAEKSPDQESRTGYYPNFPNTYSFQSHPPANSQPESAFMQNASVPVNMHPAWPNSFSPSATFDPQHSAFNSAFPLPFPPIGFNQPGLGLQSNAQFNNPQNFLPPVPFPPQHTSFTSASENVLMSTGESKEEGELSDGDLPVGQADQVPERRGRRSRSPIQERSGHQSTYGAGSSWRPSSPRLHARRESRTPPSHRSSFQRQDSFTVPSPRAARNGYDGYRPNDKDVKSQRNSSSNTVVRPTISDNYSSAVNGASHPSSPAQPSNGISNEYLTEQKERAKRSLLQFYRHSIGYDQLVEEGLDAAYLSTIYGELGIEVSRRKGRISQTSPVDMESEPYDPAAPALAIRKPSISGNRSPYSRKGDESSRSDGASLPQVQTLVSVSASNSNSAVPAAFSSASKPPRAVDSPGNSSSKQQTPVATRDDYIARLKAAKIRPKAQAELHSPSTTTPISPGPELSEAIPNLDGSSASKVPPDNSMPENSADAAHHLSQPSQPPISQTTASEIITENASSQPKNLGQEPLDDTSDAKSKREAELARLRESALASISALKSKGKSANGNSIAQPEPSAAEAMPNVSTPSISTQGVKMPQPDTIAPVDSNHSSTVDNTASSLGVSSTTPVSSLPQIPGLFMSSPTAEINPPFLSRHFSDQGINNGRERKRPVAADFGFDEEEPPTKRPFGEVRTSEEDHGIIIEASDDESVLSSRDRGIDRDQHDQSIDPQSGLASRSSYTQVDHLIRDARLASSEQQQLSRTMSTSGNETPQERTDLESHEREIEKIKQRIADMERKKRAKAFSSRTPTPSTTQQGTTTITSPMENDIQSDKRRMVPKQQKGDAPGQHSHLSQISAPPSKDLRDANEIADSSTKTQSNQPQAFQREDDRSEWLRRRRAELTTNIPALDANVANKSSQLEALREQMRQLEESMRKDSEDKQRLINELEALGVDTEGMPHSTMQDIKNELVSQAEAQQATSQPDETYGSEQHHFTPHAASNEASVINTDQDESLPSFDQSQTMQEDGLSDNVSQGSASSMSMSSVDEINDQPPTNIALPVQHRQLSATSQSISSAAPHIEQNSSSQSLAYEELDVASPVVTDSGGVSLNELDGTTSPQLQTSESQPAEQPQIKNESPDLQVQSYGNALSQHVSEVDDLDDLYGSEPGEIEEEPQSIQPNDMEAVDDYDLGSTGSDQSHQSEDGGQAMDLSDESDYEPPDSTLDETALPKSPVESEEDYEPPDAPASLEGDDYDDLSYATPAAVSNQYSLPLSPEEGALSDAVEADGVSESQREQNFDESRDQDTTPDRFLREDDRFTPYQSSLRQFKAYRYHPEYPMNVPGGFHSMTYSNAIDQNLELCPFEASGGSCNDPLCEYQHFRSMGITDDALLVELGTTNPGRNEDELRRWNESLKVKLNELRDRNIKDVEVVAAEIAAHRRIFLNDNSRLLNF